MNYDKSRVDDKDTIIFTQLRICLILFYFSLFLDLYSVYICVHVCVYCVLLGDELMSDDYT